MKKIWDILSALCIITGVCILFKGFGGMAFLREKLNLVTTYASEMEEFSLFDSKHLTSTEELSLDDSLTAQKFKEMSVCHQTIETSRCFKILEEAYRTVPSVVIDHLYDNGYQIMMVGNDIRALVRLETGWDAGYYYDGVTFPGFAGYTQIWSSAKGGSDILIHEIGHAFDHSLNLSEKQELKSLFNTEANKLFLFDPYYRSDEQEFFAQSFVLYLTTPKFLEWLLPLKHFITLMI